MVLRDEQPLAHTFADKFVDDQVPARREPTYHVEQTGRDGERYTSNTAQVTKPPEKETFLSIELVRKMLKDHNPFDVNLNPSGTGIQHQYQEIERSGVKLVFDNAAGLTWQKGSSGNFFNFDQALAYVAQLNATNYGGHSDRRLPTLREAMSLTEPKQHGEPYLDPIFDREQSFIWTMDKESAGRAWCVVFSSGLYFHFVIGNFELVSAVRSGQSIL